MNKSFENISKIWMHFLEFLIIRNILSLFFNFWKFSKSFLKILVGKWSTLLACGSESVMIRSVIVALCSWPHLVFSCRRPYGKWRKDSCTRGTSWPRDNSRNPSSSTSVFRLTNFVMKVPIMYFVWDQNVRNFRINTYLVPIVTFKFRMVNSIPLECLQYLL